MPLVCFLCFLFLKQTFETLVPKLLLTSLPPEEIAAALKELPPDQLAKIRACMKESCPGPVDCSSITVVAKDYKGMLAQPSAPKFKGALAQIYVRNQPYGGSDKSSNGHRYDSMCIVNGMINSGLELPADPLHT